MTIVTLLCSARCGSRHDFLEYEGKYYCKRCWDEITSIKMGVGVYGKEKNSKKKNRN